MMRTKALCLALCLALLLPASSGGKTRRLRLGSSVYTMEVDASFRNRPVSEDDAADGQAASLCSDRLAAVIDVYRFGKDGRPGDLAAFAEQRADGCDGVIEFVTGVEINGIPVAWYRAVSDRGGSASETLAYLLDGGDAYVEVVFRLDADAADAVADAIIRTLARDGEGEPPDGEGAVLLEEVEETYTARRTSGDASPGGDAVDGAAGAEE